MIIQGIMGIRNKKLQDFINKYFFEQFQDISLDSYSVAASEDNYEKLVQISLNSLQKTDPQNANLEQAAKIADRMQAFARQKLKVLEEK